MDYNVLCFERAHVLDLDETALAPEETFRMRVLRPRPDSQVVVIEVAGSLDMVSTPRFAEVLRARLASAVRMVMLDLSGVTFLSVGAIDALLGNERRARMQGRQLVLTTGCTAVDRPLRMLGLADRFRYGKRPVFSAMGTEPGGQDREPVTGAESSAGDGGPSAPRTG